jgi:hypothetical protein
LRHIFSADIRQFRSGITHPFQEDAMRKIQLNPDALEVRSFSTTALDTTPNQDVARTELCSAVSETDGVFQCKSCGPCCL